MVRQAEAEDKKRRTMRRPVTQEISTTAQNRKRGRAGAGLVSEVRAVVLYRPKLPHGKGAVACEAATR